ncbi:MAG: DNA primase [Bacteroidales bacterium]|jgi:DNA primase|nr:DNA primase [Bacteroidales bacterium]MDY0314250.1 DNA primase [Bacteroidales bacterium]
MIDQITVQKIMDAAEITSVVQDFVSLKRRGANYLGLCPFHNEKTPSFTVSPAKGIFKCFGCGKAGNSVSFIMAHEQVSYPEALKYLAKKYNIHVEEKELTEEDIRINTERESMNIVNEAACKYFENILFNSDEGISIGLSYFKERGFNEQVIKEFRLGYSLEAKTTFTDWALKNGYKKEFLESTGLSIFKENYSFDRFAARVTFPILGISGQVVGFGARTLSADKKTAKYLNSPESIVYNKSKIVYGLFHAKHEIIKQEKCFLVEGYMDVISLFMSGIKNVVASSGTSLTEDQIRQIHRFTENITILYDSDLAGIKASIRAIDLILEQGLDVRIVLFPEGEDPDSYAKKYGSAKTIEYIEKNEKDFISFKANLLSDEAKNDPIKRSSLITDIVRSIAIINNSIKQSVYIQECSKILEIEQSVLYAEVSKIRRSKIDSIKKQEYRYAPPIKTTPSLPVLSEDIYFESQEKEIIRLLLLYGNNKIKIKDVKTDIEIEVSVAQFIINELRNEGLEFKNVINKKIFLFAEELLKDIEDINIDLFTQNSDPEISEVSANLCSSKYELSVIWEKRGAPLLKEEKKLPEILEDVFIKYKLKIVKELEIQVKNKLKLLKENDNENSLQTALIEFTKIKEYLKELSALQGRVIL